MVEPKIKIQDYSYNLPQERIAKYPLEKRDSSKLLIYNKGEIKESIFRTLPSFIPQGSLMVFNNT
ncbi:MAG: S-adenosylmethionine:tRNA ribosyltransferase-isomerase, partial [Bacteroidales bacterium]|nr:S-adenosylmethionine:tRNA ribosyltransferase-isomerase [Bacteroidales bacterium]